MKLSIVIPVYRVEATLERCLQSVVGQTFSDMEIILVDDGSPDRCPAMCDDWARRDGRIRVIHKPNGGLSDARNAGIDAATGDCITFVDSDDYLQTDTYAQALALMDDADIMEFPVFRHYGSPRQQLLNGGVATYRDAEDYWLRGRAYDHAYACNKIYRRKLFDGVRFPKGKVFEDVYLLPQLIRKARLIKTTDQGLYYYCANPDGITAQAKGPQLEMLLGAYMLVIDTWCDDGFYVHVANVQIDVCRLTGQPPVLQPRRIRLSGVPRSLLTKALCLNALGLKNTIKLSTLIRQWKKKS